MYPTVLIFMICASLAVSATSGSGIILPLRRRATSNPTRLTAYGTFFDTEVTIGKQKFQLLVDTGSSDIWVVQTGYQCLDGTNFTKLPQAACSWNTTYDVSSTFEQIANETLGIQYGAGVAFGKVGKEDVTVGGITVRGQTIGVANEVTIPGDGIDSGILGLGYPPLTSAHPGTTTPNVTMLLLNKVPYDPVVVSMSKQGSIESYFSLAIDRLAPNTTTGPGGYLGLGALPPVNHSSNFATAPVEITEGIPLLFTNGNREITEWTLSVDGVTWGHGDNSSHSTYSTRFQAVVDSGNYMNQLPVEIADAVHKAYDPPAKFDSRTGQYAIQCNATPPSLGITIGGQIFHHRPEDLVLQFPNGSCVSTVLPPASGNGGLTLSFLGDVFLRNVVSVFDFGKNEMRFAARIDVESGNSSGATPPPEQSSAGNARRTCVGMVLLSAIVSIAVL